MELYFKENFFSTGKSPILEASGIQAGTLDMKHMLSSSLSVLDSSGRKVCSDSSRLLSLGRKWDITDGRGNILGVLRPRFTLLAKKYEYDAGRRGIFDIESPLLSKHYTIRDSSDALAAEFRQVNGWLQSGAFRLRNESPMLDSFELIAVIMGVHELQRRNHMTGSTTESQTYTPNQF
ncbi:MULTISPECIES: hypothetical protein [unclassified Paenibacillus]|uniref:hypothetical protein n=1 Tax=unclassified Paenibacillus TaxID=185978 RepID=UPI00020D6BE6|nr:MULTISPECIES: hypothetical protein [unclassified Paenibacillus]EGL16510.1 hypothetical protein HMPREF9413_2694 [Paenibacillus sp. HGF7]EPD89052.1 hypothetical protein HMPREF1207_01795 [Paenibacillus sp. HGH0039]